MSVRDVIISAAGVLDLQEVILQATDKQDYDNFGWSVALSSDGNTAAVCAPYDDLTSPVATNAGSIYIFVRTGNTWQPSGRLQASDAGVDDELGFSVALSSDGNTLAVGGLVDISSPSSAVDAGNVYIFTRSGTTWTQQARLQASDAAAYDRFGDSVSISSDGNTVAIGTPQDTLASPVVSGAGSVYIFTRSGNTWTQQTRLQASDAAAGDRFGETVSLSSDGNTLAIGTPEDDLTSPSATGAGSVYIFTRSGTTWTQQTRLQASDAAATDRFGWSVALSSDGNTLAVGAPYDDLTSPAAANAGSVYIFTRSGNTWTQQTRLQASDAAASDLFGWSVALSSSGDTLVVGAYNAKVFNLTLMSAAGKVYVFKRATSSWTEQFIVRASNATSSAQLGYSVGINSDGSIILAGANSANAAYIYYTKPEPWAKTLELFASPAAPNDAFGWSVALSSDGNTLAVGASYDDLTSPVAADAGSVYIYTRSGNTWTQQTRLQASDAAAGDGFGASVALSSDGNTLATGAISDDLTSPAAANAGSVYIFTRSGTTWTQQTRLQASDAAADDYFAKSVALSSDGNTLAVGSPYDDLTSPAAANAGSVYIFTRSGNTWTQQIRLQASDAAAGDLFGWSVALSSDGNTLAMGAMSDDLTSPAAANAGSVYIFTRSGNTWTQQTRLQASDADVVDGFGSSVALSSDGNTLAVGSPYDDLTSPAAADAGSVYIFTRSGTTWTQETRLQASDAAATDRFGWSVALSSDGNTLAVGAPDANTSIGAWAGKVYMFAKVSSGTWVQESSIKRHYSAEAYLGSSIAIDGVGAMVVAGAYTASSTYAYQGSINVFYSE